MPVTDLSLELRQAVVAHLRADASLTALVEPASIYGEFATQETGTFIRLSDQDVTGWEATCWSGSENTLAIHAFADGPGRDGIQKICKRIVAAMEAFSPAVVSLADSEWIGTAIVTDVVPQKLHGVVRYRLVPVEVG